MKRELFWFAAVGLSAMAVHLASVALVLVPLGLSPLMANVIAFLIAFQVSHAGHRRFTFSHHDAPASQSRWRFFAVACFSFAVNELMYAALLRFTTLDYRVALFIVLVLVAALTYVSSRAWAFAPADHAQAATPSAPSEDA